jgi:hypothetical protein
MRRILPILSFLIIGIQGFAQSTALHLDGVNDYVSISNKSSLNGPSKITIESWVYLENFNSSPCGDCAPVVWQQDNAYRFGTGNAQGIHFTLAGSSGNQSLNISSALKANTWHHIAGTFDGSKMRVYVDGILKDSTNTSFSSINYKSSNTAVWIGDPVTGYGGILEETRIWDYARNTAQIKDGMYRKYPDNESGLVLQLSYEDGVPYKNNTAITGVVDNTLNANDGVLNNFDLQDSTSNFVLGRSYCDTTIYASMKLWVCDKYTAPSKKWSTSVSGKFQDTIMSYRGCDSVITIEVNIKKSTGSILYFAQCDSVKSPAIPNLYYKKSGKFMERIKNAAGCDSLITVNVLITKPSYTEYSYSNCYSVTMKNGKTVTKSGTYIDSFVGFGGCDSVIVHKVTVKEQTYAKQSLGICRFVVCPTNKDKVFKKEGIYYDTIKNRVGCDSIIEYNVKSSSTKGTTKVMACTQYKSPSGTYTWKSSGTYGDTLIGGNKAGCDSFITIDLTIIKPVNENLSPIGCGVYVSPLGNKIYSSGTYNETLKSSLGCDSIKYTLNVSIVNVNTQVSRDWNTLISSATAASYRWLDCKNSLSFITGETNQEFTPTGSGQFAVEVTQSGCIDTSACVTFAWTDIVKPLKVTVKLMPNPNSGRFRIELDQSINNVHAQVLDINGKLIWEDDWQELLTKEVSIELIPGLYFIRLDSTSGSWIDKLKVE